MAKFVQDVAGNELLASVYNIDSYCFYDEDEATRLCTIGPDFYYVVLKSAHSYIRDGLLLKNERTLYRDVYLLNHYFNDSVISEAAQEFSRSIKLPALRTGTPEETARLLSDMAVIGLRRFAERVKSGVGSIDTMSAIDNCHAIEITRGTFYIFDLLVNYSFSYALIVRK